MAAILLELEEERHYRPHAPVLAYEKGHHEISISRRERTEGDHGQYRLAEAHGDLQEYAEFAGAVEGCAFVELLRKRIKEPLEQEYRISIGESGKNQRIEAVQEIEFPEIQEGRYLRYHRRERHRQHQEKQDLVCTWWTVPTERVCRKRIHDKRAENSQGTVNYGVEQCASMHDKIINDGQEVPFDKLCDDSIFPVLEIKQVVVLLGGNYLIPCLEGCAQ